MRIKVYIQEARNSEDGFTADECATLHRFDQVISECWVRSSNSTSNLRWEYRGVNDQNQRVAELVAVDNGRLIHHEPLYSLRTKRPENFEIEFIRAANEYSTTN